MIFGAIIQYLIIAEPQVKPAPKAANNKVSPRFILPSRTAWSSASGMDAPEVFACSSTVAITRSIGIPNFFAAALIMRMFAW